MILAFSPADIVQVPFGWLLAFLYDFVGNYGWALILFAFIVKLVLLPATAKGKKSTMKMSRLTPRLEEIKAKYANDPQKQNEAMQALYKSEGVSMGGGCLWSFLPILILIPLYTVVREPIAYILHVPEAWDVIRETLAEVTTGIFGEKVGFYDQMLAAPLIPKYIDAIQAALAEANLPALSAQAAQGVDFTFLGINLAAIPSWKVWAWEITGEKPLWYYIGGVLMPLLSAGGQIVSMLLNQKLNNSLITNEKGIQDKEAAKNSQTNQSMKMMMWVSPLMSLWIGFSMPAALSLYWFAQGIVTTVSDVILTKHYRKIYDKEDAARLEKALAEDAREAEKERIRAERRAANPDGITTNTSKKKLQQAKQEAKEAQKAASAREYAAKKGEVIEDAKKDSEPLSGVAARPNCKGRAYDPNRYKTDNTEEE